MSVPSSLADRRCVVVGVDFSESSLTAARWAAREFAPATRLILVHVTPKPDPPPLLRGLCPSRESAIEPAPAGIENRLRQFATRVTTGPAWTEIRVGHPDEALALVARDYDADLIVLGRHGDPAGLRDRLGSTAERILSRSPIPVLVVENPPFAAPKMLLVAVDGSGSTPQVLRWTLALVRQFGANATVLYVLPDLDAPRAKTESLREAAIAWLIEETAALTLDERITPAVAVGSPAVTIASEAAARQSDLIVLGSRGLDTVRRFVLGSVSASVLRSAPCPVLVVPASPQSE